MIYVASPYSHPDHMVQVHRYLMAEEYVVAAMKQKIVAYSPIVYCHPIAERHSLPGDAAYWKEFNNSIMRRCEGFHLLELIGWRESKGVQYELMMAQELSIPIIRIEYSSERFPEGKTP